MLIQFTSQLQIFSKIVDLNVVVFGKFVKFTVVSKPLHGQYTELDSKQGEHKCNQATLTLLHM